ncbi:MAG: DMT family transporter [Pseudomonadota bacterium]
MTDVQKGWLFGVAATFVAGLHTVFAQRAGAMGLDPLDLLAIRYGVAALLLLPIFIRLLMQKRLQTLGLARTAALCVFGGVGFVFFFFSGFQYAPLAHGAVFPPGTSAVFGALLAYVFRGELFGYSRALSLTFIVAGLVLVSGSALLDAGAQTWRGDLLFMAAGASWAVFLLMLAQWRVPALEATAVISVITAAFLVPLYSVTAGFEGLFSVKPMDLFFQALVQGMFAGVGAIYLFARSAAYLSTAVSSALPGLVPLQALALGALLFGILPSALSLVGVALVLVGQYISLRTPQTTPAH